MICGSMPPNAEDPQGLAADAMQLFAASKSVSLAHNADGEACVPMISENSLKVGIYAGVRGETAAHRIADAGHKNRTRHYDEKAQRAEQLSGSPKRPNGLAMILRAARSGLPSLLKSKARFRLAARSSAQWRSRGCCSFASVPPATAKPETAALGTAAMPGSLPAA